MCCSAETSVPTHCSCITPGKKPSGPVKTWFKKVLPVPTTTSPTASRGMTKPAKKSGEKTRLLRKARKEEEPQEASPEKTPSVWRGLLRACRGRKSSIDDNQKEARALPLHVTPPVEVPRQYRLQDRNGGMQVGGKKVVFTRSGHAKKRRAMKKLRTVPEHADMIMPEAQLTSTQAYMSRAYYPGGKRSAQKQQG
ncbi:TPA: hypothetical protein N0F65_007964 [Lagenidium giganteum]|uniref:Uncharacterized protein n=1 Tax=Lagenidium giganteum TaxID=4803 RepID=A0AAV2YHU9_9STRA|nr:TPA: hypothetical protein N0F65_007964 [Lagenidium giganteum]